MGEFLSDLLEAETAELRFFVKYWNVWVGIIVGGIGDGFCMSGGRDDESE